MKQFAKLFELEHHGQVLVRRTSDEEGPCLTVSFLDGSKDATYGFYFENDAEGLTALNTSFENLDDDSIPDLVDEIKELISGSDEQSAPTFMH